MIRTLEEYSLNAWPALQTVLFDGWVLRFADGYTRRANSVNPLYAAHEALEDKLAGCEAYYRQRGLPVIFKITPAVQPADLDAQLEAHGYAKDAATFVETLDLTQKQMQISDAAIYTEVLTDDWLDDFSRMNLLTTERRQTLKKMLGNLQPQACYLVLKQDGQTVACGLGVLENGYVGLFDIYTDGQHRQRGYGTAAVESILAWARAKGAHTAYLQVMQNNPPALKLYEKLGFKEVYSYWYRIKD